MLTIDVDRRCFLSEVRAETEATIFVSQTVPCDVHAEAEEMIEHIIQYSKTGL
jgi:hypothetical protein